MRQRQELWSRRQHGSVGDDNILLNSFPSLLEIGEIEIGKFHDVKIQSVKYRIVLSINEEDNEEGKDEREEKRARRLSPQTRVRCVVYGTDHGHSLAEPKHFFHWVM